MVAKSEKGGIFPGVWGLLRPPVGSPKIFWILHSERVKNSRSREYVYKNQPTMKQSETYFTRLKKDHNSIGINKKKKWMIWESNLFVITALSFLHENQNWYFFVCFRLSFKKENYFKSRSQRILYLIYTVLTLFQWK